MSVLPQESTLQGGKYKIIRFISAGGFGCTYEGIHVLLKKRVAIKEFFVKDFCNRDEATSGVTIGITSKTALVNKLRLKFEEEAQFVSTLKHPNIVNVYDVFEENGTAYYVMDYINGPSLNDMVKSKGAMSEQKATRYILQVAEALKYVHSMNRLHLDVKPGNVMLDEDDNAILIDFGTSKQYDEEAGENTSTLMGKTPGFAPLEQMGNDVVKFYPSTDIYALGATFYKLLTGNTPDSSTLLASGEDLQPLPLSISENVRNAVYKAMQINKTKRPQSVDEFIQMVKTPVEDDRTIYDADEEDPTEVACDEGKKKDKDDQPKSPITPTKKEIKPVLYFLVAILCSCIFIYQIASTNRVSNQKFKDAEGKSFIYTGEVVNQVPNGEGKGVYQYGYYDGEYKNGLRHGDGKFESKDGKNKFVGTFVNDKYDKGKLTLPDGYYFKGQFKNGQPYNGKWYDKQGQIDCEVVNGN